MGAGDRLHPFHIQISPNIHPPHLLRGESDIIMKMNPFQTLVPQIDDNSLLRTPQREAHAELAGFAQNRDKKEREVGIVLPVGCGKSGCITLAPFALGSIRTLIVAPGLKIARQLIDDFDYSRRGMFYIKCGVLKGPPFPEPAEIRGRTTNRADLEKADVVITNIQQLQGDENRWLESLPEDFFDLILFDEGHHNVAKSWETLKARFPQARIVNFSATPMRADGQVMAGRILYSYPVFDAIRKGYVKRLKAVALNPETLRYVRREDGQEIEVGLEEVRRLGEQDADFRRSIVTSTETLDTLVDASIRELEKRRQATGDPRLKIIASALNFEHCRQVVEAYRDRDLRADFVHSRKKSADNDQVLQRLEDHELDVIAQVRKLGEGFDHPFLAVAAVFSLYANLSPFVQFVGRIMRVIEQNAPGSLLNQGIVVFHAGANIAGRWDDFRKFSQADQEFFDQLLPGEEKLDFRSGSEQVVEPRDSRDGMDVRSQTAIQREEIPLVPEITGAMAAPRVLLERGGSSDEGKPVFSEQQPVPVPLVRQRQAKRKGLDERVQTETRRILRERRVNPGGRNLDRPRFVRTNYVSLKAAIDRQVDATVGRKFRERDRFTRDELDRIERDFGSILQRAEQEVFNGEK